MFSWAVCTHAGSVCNDITIEIGFGLDRNKETEAMG